MMDSAPKRMRYICDISGMDAPSRPPNMASLWHTVEENERLFAGLGVDSFTIATEICKMRVGSKGVATYDEYRGIAVFVKDFARRCNFIRVYHNTTLGLLYEIELLDMFKHKVHRSDNKRLTIWMGQHCIDLIFIDRNNLCLFRNKLLRVGIEKVNPTLTKRVQNCWDRAKGLVNGIFQEKGNESYVSQHSEMSGTVADSMSFEPRGSRVTKYMYRKPNNVRGSSFGNNTPVKLLGTKRKMIPCNQDSSPRSNTKKGTSVYGTPCETNSQRMISPPIPEPQSNIRSNQPPQVSFPSPPETPRGVIKNQRRQTIQCSRKTEQFDLQEQPSIDESEHKRYSCSSKYISRHDNVAEPPIVKGLIRTVPRPIEYPPPLLNNIDYSSNNEGTPSIKPLPIDLLAQIRSAPNLRVPNNRTLVNKTPHSLHQKEPPCSPLHMIRSAMLQRRISVIGDASEDEMDASGWSIDDIGWRKKAEALRPNYNRK